MAIPVAYDQPGVAARIAHHRTGVVTSLDKLVYAYEPMPPTYAVLQQNVEAHGLCRLVHTRNIGLSDRAEEKMMFHYLNLSVWKR